MKKLTLVRHAKSSWRHEGLRDFERPLNRRGRGDAPLMGQRLAELGTKPDLILTSHATRALTTARIFALQLGYPIEQLRLHECIYDASDQALLDLIRTTPEDIEHLCLIGHNPGLTGLARLLGVQSLSNIPTCGMVVFNIKAATWAELDSLGANLDCMDMPKKL
ncbi:SixA phosphatase family protein [Pontibacter sp. JAM-7]|uniref:SixA phosphatase family protein n=1 Tax=Pontibacter sp. JAM-7 TaxID=3366581 RepID=UPI003AF46576